ncbi:MAG: SUF system Fe-S cluster assembly regulator [Burkholderiales bacterium]|jgi:FeS assembly SUF system regulator|nr:MAG: SUF system Fe-S cluster assembly regulator [Burkholderiales bacterium]
MLRINRLTDYGTLALTYLAMHPERMHSAADVAAELGLGVPTVSKVLKALGRHDLVRSIRGLRGGYSLSRAPEAISVADIVDALEEQPFGLTECSASAGLCGFERNCRIRSNWLRINRIVRRTLEDVSLADMMRVVPLDEAQERAPKAKPDRTTAVSRKRASRPPAAQPAQPREESIA